MCGRLAANACVSLAQSVPSRYLFHRDQHRGIRWSDLQDAGDHIPQRRRGTHDLLKHEHLVNLLREQHVLIAKMVGEASDFVVGLFESVLGMFSFMNVGNQNLPTHNLPRLIPLGMKPSVVPAANTIRSA